MFGFNQNIPTRMKCFLFTLIFFLTLNFQAQPDSLFLKLPPKKYDGPEWTRKNQASVDINQVSFVNWNAGGSNSISGLVGARTIANYNDRYFTWRNEAQFRFGVNKQEDRELRKTDDLFEVISNLGFQPDSLSNWFYSARFSFRTQLSNGYKYPNKDNPISRFLAPGYLFFGGGMEYGKNIERISFYFSPITLKATFVLDEDLANAGSFGVTPAVYDIDGNIIRAGEKLRREFGILVTNSYEMEVVENVDLIQRVSLYTDYINNFGNIDLDWRVDFNFKVNSYIRATFGSHLRYDDDVKTQVATEVEGEFEEAGPKLQWKQFLGVGLALDF